MSHPDECLNEQRLSNVETSVARHDEQLKTIFKDTERLENNINTLVETNQTLALLCTELQNTVKVLKWVCATLISGTGLVFVILEFAMKFGFGG